MTGPPLTPPETPEKIVDSARYLWRIMSGAEIIDPPYGYGWYVDVRDVAKLILFAVARADEADGRDTLKAVGQGFVPYDQSLLDMAKMTEHLFE